MTRQITIMDPRRFFGESFADAFFHNALVNTDITGNELEMYEDDDNVVVKVKAPGFDENSIDINIEDNLLTISGKVEEKKEEQDQKKKYYYKEIRHEAFSRSVSLPVKVKADNAEAAFKDGMLTIKMPKAEEIKPKKISIKASSK